MIKYVIITVFSLKRSEITAFKSLWFSDVLSSATLKEHNVLIFDSSTHKDNNMFVCLRLC